MTPIRSIAAFFAWFISCTSTLKTHVSKPLLSICLLLTGAVASSHAAHEKLDHLVTLAEANRKIPGGSVRVVENQTIAYDRVFGTLSAQSGTPWSEDTPVAIASISKSITATLVAVLVGEGSLNFDDPISAYLPEYDDLKLQKNGKPVRSPTIAECLSHTAGFPGGTMSSQPRNSPIRRGDQAEVARYLAAQGLATEPGTKYAYSFRGFAAVSRVVEIVTNRSFSEVLREKLLEPLGMDETTFTPDAPMARRLPMFAPHTVGLNDDEVAVQLERLRARQGKFINTAGALISTAADLQRFLQFHADQGQVGDQPIVARHVLEQLYQPQPASPQYGLGFALRGETIVGHGGATGTAAHVDLATSRMFIVLTQAGANNARPLTSGAQKITFP